MSLLLKQILEMDKKSEEFNELYHAVREKYWDFDEADLDDYRKAAKLLNDLANRDVPDLIISTAYIASSVFNVLEQGLGASTAELHVGDKKLFFRVAVSPDEIDRLRRLLSNTVIVQSNKETNEDSK